MEVFCTDNGSLWHTQRPTIPSVYLQSTRGYEESVEVLLRVKCRTPGGNFCNMVERFTPNGAEHGRATFIAQLYGSVGDGRS